ncbi:MAG: histidyl-tRNA synthetase [uncultured bacterium (gcode 4)]|uniref:histidine--tRNA ligase n=1 Tax=uncultured bacterium (gcode 4) TaxID=1234023 RepID=K2FZK7_9BACT|nr:MAG: histidyl-tRNA synthetase [uncultured bacterium (gcode 4)]
MKKNLLPGWFPELSPLDQAIENQIKDIIRETYETYWYFNIETPAIEYNEVLIAKWWEEVSKQIFWLYWLKQWAEDLKNYSLRFDLTVPLARYIVQNEDSIQFPFKRYQIQKVWRWERQQKWRFKEFTQCDIDIIWTDLSLNYDIEIIETLDMTLKNIFNKLRIGKKFEIRVNNKKFLDSISEYFKIKWKDKDLFYRLLDDYYKISKDEFMDRLKDITCSWKILLDILETWEIREIESENIINSFKETFLLIDSLKNKWVNVKFDPFITRWLDYYTWTVFETFLVDYPEFWSICSGWSYDNLVNSIREISWMKVVSDKKNYWWVGWSIWLTRLFSRFKDNNLINTEIPLAQAMIFNVPWNSTYYIDKIAKKLRESWISTDVYYGNEKLAKQFSYAESKKILFWIFAGTEEERTNSVILKDLKSKQNQTIDFDAICIEIFKKLNSAAWAYEL